MNNNQVSKNIFFSALSIVLFGASPNYSYAQQTPNCPAGSSPKLVSCSLICIGPAQLQKCYHCLKPDGTNVGVEYCTNPNPINPTPGFPNLSCVAPGPNDRRPTNTERGLCSRPELKECRVIGIVQAPPSPAWTLNCDNVNNPNPQAPNAPAAPRDRKQLKEGAGDVSTILMLGSDSKASKSNLSSY
jgi:hypothetical protein